MSKVIVSIVQIAVGVAVGNVASDVVNKVVYEPLQKIIDAKKAES